MLLCSRLTSQKCTSYSFSFKNINIMKSVLEEKGKYSLYGVFLIKCDQIKLKFVSK